MKNYKQLLVYAIVGINFPSYALADKYTDAGLARFTGNQWNETWKWNILILAELSEARLQGIFEELLAAKEDLHKKVLANGFQPLG